MSLAKTPTVDEAKKRNRNLIAEVLSGLSRKGEDRQRRAKHLMVNEEVAGVGEEVASPRTASPLPGVMTIRGCAYAGSKRRGAGVR